MIYSRPSGARKGQTDWTCVRPFWVRAFLRASWRFLRVTIIVLTNFAQFSRAERFSVATTQYDVDLTCHV